MKRLLLALLLICSPCYATEDLTTYTKVDGSGSGTLTVTADEASTSSDYDTRDNDAHVVKDFGVDACGDFVINFTYIMTSSANYTDHQVFVLSNEAGEHDDSIMFTYYKETTTETHYLFQKEGGVTGSTDSAASATTEPSTIYLELERSGTDVTLKTCSDGTYSSCTFTWLSISGIADVNYQFVHPFYSVDTGDNTSETEFSVSDVIIQSGCSSASRNRMVIIQ